VLIADHRTQRCADSAAHWQAAGATVAEKKDARQCPGQRDVKVLKTALVWPAPEVKTLRVLGNQRLTPGLP
jgi:hypothetical protein